jgi:hypothetical protein
MAKRQARVIMNKKRGKYQERICNFEQHNAVRHVQVQ